jgi:hypothetical protein
MTAEIALVQVSSHIVAILMPENVYQSTAA